MNHRQTSPSHYHRGRRPRVETRGVQHPGKHRPGVRVRAIEGIAADYIDDEIRGLDQRLASSLSDEVGRLDDLIRDLYLRIDTFVAEVGRVDALIEVVELRLAEAVELKGQDRSAERAEARRMAALDARLTELEGRSAQGG